MGAKTFQELYAWQLSAKLRDEIVAICATGALNSDVKFRDQIRDAACSAPSLIAEGFGRFGRREFVATSRWPGQSCSKSRTTSPTWGSAVWSEPRM